MTDKRDEDWTTAADTGQAPETPLSPQERDEVLQRIGALRDEIDRLDEQLVQLLSRRAGCALGIGKLKTALGMQVYQPSREQAVLQHVRGLNEGPLDDDAIARLFERIIDEARRLERVVHDETGRQD
jgi:chorismate mutase